MIIAWTYEEQRSHCSIILDNRQTKLERLVVTPNSDRQYTGCAMSCQNEQPHVLIIGAGITGLVLAQSLKTHGIPFTVFERDPEPSTRGRGWGLTIHWALDTFLSLLPQSLIDRLPETYVDPVAVEKGEKANFLFFDIRSGESRWQVPAAKRMRVSRERLRKLMTEDIEVKVGEILMSFPETSFL